MKFFFFFVISLLIKDCCCLPNECLLTFDNQTRVSSELICPSSCFTTDYLSNHFQYPIYGNETYSGNSLICKSAVHAGRIFPWPQQNSAIRFQLNSGQSSIYVNTLRNGILSSKSTNVQMNSYSFQTIRLNESSLLDIAIEHRGFVYTANSSSSITCRSSSSEVKVQTIEIDQGWKSWKENALKYFTHPRKNLSRNDALQFCRNNNATLFYWSNSSELDFITNQLMTTVSQLFREEFFRFYIGFKQVNQIKQWQDQVINYNENSSSVKVNLTLNSNEDYCTIIECSSTNRQLFQIVSHRCDSQETNVYPLCRLQPAIERSDTRLIYRLESDTQAGNLTGVTSFCYELGGYPIYANNAYEWHLIQEIMLKDEDFVEKYVYTGLISESKRENDCYWTPRNISYNSSLSFVWFGEPRDVANGIGYHLSRADGESYYKLYDMNPETRLNNLRFCRKDNLANLIVNSASCSSKECKTTSCLNKTLPTHSDNLRFSLYSCIPKNSLSSIVYSHSFPLSGDFYRPNWPMNLSVSIRIPFTQLSTLNLNQTDSDVNLDCFQYLNFDRSETLNDSLLLTCDRSRSTNKTFEGISMKNNFNGLVSIGFKDRRMSSYHFRFIDFDSNSLECSSQGIVHPTIHQCICSPGFYGDKCQYSYVCCPTGFYGQSCTFECFGDDDSCKGLLICLSDPYGCSCYSGWYGAKCDLKCPSDRYGPNCLYKCSCNECNRFTGVCNCEGNECYSGPISRKSLENLCETSRNLVVLIVVPIVSILVLIGMIGAFFIWKKKRSADEQALFQPSQDLSFHDDYIISERL